MVNTIACSSSLGHLTVSPGQTVRVNFTAQRSTGQITSYAWKINGTFVSTSRDFSFDLVQPAIFQVLAPETFDRFAWIFCGIIKSVLTPCCGRIWKRMPNQISQHELIDIICCQQRFNILKIAFKGTGTFHFKRCQGGGIFDRFFRRFA
jgi:hypothetical protein